MGGFWADGLKTEGRAAKSKTARVLLQPGPWWLMSHAVRDVQDTGAPGKAPSKPLPRSTSAGAAAHARCAATTRGQTGSAVGSSWRFMVFRWGGWAAASSGKTFRCRLAQMINTELSVGK